MSVGQRQFQNSKAGKCLSSNVDISIKIHEHQLKLIVIEFKASQKRIECCNSLLIFSAYLNIGGFFCTPSHNHYCIEICF